MSELRIIGGRARGRRIRSVPGETTRPITDKVREALFNIIGPDIHGAVFLDLFAGTGSVGIEALSRGAQFTTFVDINRKAISTVYENLKLTGLQDGSEVIQSNTIKLLNQEPSRKYDYVYIAPPQYKGIWLEALRKLEENLNWISDDAWVIVQIHPVEYVNLSEESKTGGLVEFDQRHYGSTLLVFYARPEVV